MLGITEKYNQFKKSTYFAGGKFVIYAACVYLAATFAAGCLGAVIGFPLLTFPLAMLISNPVVWVLMGVVLTAAYKMVVKPLFHLAKDYINKKKAPEGEKSEEKEVEPQKSPEKQEQTVANQERPKTPGRDSGIFECEENFVHETNNGNYEYKLSTTDIRDIAKSSYGWIADKDRKGLKNASKGVYFACPGNFTSSLEAELQEYKNKEDSNLVFTSILNLNGNHWVTLVVSYDKKSKKLRAYCCDSFGKSLLEKVSSALQKTLGVDNSSIESSKIKQQTDTHNCGIFALENAHRITQMFNENKSSDEIKRELSEYKPNEEELKNKRIEFAKVLEKYKRSGVNMPDSQRKSRRSSVASGDSGVDVNSAKDKRYKVVKYSTSGERNNCFFHSVFGEKDSVGTYQTKKAQEMRMEWHEFLSQFNSLDDERMPPALRAELRTVFNMFLDRPRDLTDKYKEIEKLAEHTKKKMKKVEKKVRKLIKKLLSTGLPENEVSSNLRELAVNNLISTKRYDKNYGSESVTNSFLNGKSIYKSYLEAIKSPYQVFTEEIPILASLANIEIHLHPHISHNQGIFKPNPEMINEGYQRNNELWGNKKQETIYLTPGHYERAGIVEVETSFIEKVSSFMQGVTTAVCNIVKNAFSSN